eukprot:TRINITY_DN24868_c0_g1_i1.p1 TRINITY_DN24868_c0_g1~~TRINITY_DN24868_c0_g1_i1.p1  ORF type:complete len:353 (+),score=153.49 TRINITY_DN24868_c0_g1_i1:137-1060(+)
MALVGQNASLVMTTRYASAMRTGPAFIPATLVVCTEIVKLVVSVLLVQYTDARGAFAALASEVENHKQSCLQCIVPALCYTVSSNFLYIALANLEVTLFQVCSQSKVLVTAGWSMALLDRTFSARKWAALSVLSVGIVLCSLQSSGKKNADGAARVQDVTSGLIAIFVASMSASFGGVYFEKLLKKDPRSKDVSLWMRNVWLSLASLGFAFGGLFGSHGMHADFFRGFDLWVVVVIALQALGGFVVALCVKYADNVLKGFATAFSILLCGALSFFLFGFRPSGTFGAGVLLVAGSTLLYSLREDAPK